MAKKNQAAQEEQLVDIGGTYSRFETFLRKNKTLVYIALGVVLVGIGGYLYYNEYVRKPKIREAEAEIFKAEYFFRLDSLNLALNGAEGQFTGLLDIASEYSGTPAGNRANYMIGVIYLHQGKFEDAIAYLKKFSSSDVFLGPQALGCIGDAYRELGDSEQAAKYYVKAYKKSSNELTTPMYLKKAAMTYEDDLQDTDEALKLYKKIRDEYGYLTDYSDISKYIARIESSTQP